MGLPESTAPSQCWNMSVDVVGQYLSSAICSLFVSSFSRELIIQLESQMLGNLAKLQKCFPVSFLFSLNEK